MKHACLDLDARVSIFETENRKLKSTVEALNKEIRTYRRPCVSDVNDAAPFENSWRTVKNVDREEVQMDARRSNVVLSGIVEDNSEDITTIVKSILPEGVLVLEAQRIGRLPPAKSAGNSIPSKESR